MKFRLEFSTDNAAFMAEAPAEAITDAAACNMEIARILRETADRLDHGEYSGEMRIVDANGNSIGKASIIS